MIKEPVGSTMGFSGGAEQTPIVTIGHKANELALRCYVYGRADREVVLTESEASTLIEWAKDKPQGYTESLAFGTCSLHKFEEARSLNCGSSQVRIVQEDRILHISTETLARVLAWARCEGMWSR